MPQFWISVSLSLHVKTLTHWSPWQAVLNTVKKQNAATRHQQNVVFNICSRHSCAEAMQCKRHCQKQNTHSDQPPTRQNMCGVDYLRQVHAETQQGKPLVFSIHCPLNPLMNTGTHISLTTAPPLSSDSLVKPAIGLKSAKHNLAILLVLWRTCREETTSKNKRSWKRVRVVR